VALFAKPNRLKFLIPRVRIDHVQLFLYDFGLRAKLQENKMLKKLWIAITSALLVGAGAAVAEPGPYVGVGVGGNGGSWSVQDNNSKNYGFNSKGVIGTLFTGYAFNADHFYLSLEAFVDEASNKSGTKSINAGTTNRYTRQTYSYGVSALPGFIIADSTVVFVRGGVVRSHFQISDTLLGATTSYNTTLTGAQAGLGAQTAVSASLDVRGEYIYSSYNSYNNINGRFTPRDNQVSISLAYRLG
jgi:outer membrane immunogenic protein